MLINTTKLFRKKHLAYYFFALFCVLFFNIKLFAQTQEIELETGKYNFKQILFVTDIVQDSKCFGCSLGFLGYLHKT